MHSTTPRSSSVPSGDVITEERVTPATNDGGDHERFAHYVKKSAILPSTIEGTPLEALCGKKWVPSRDPQKFPVCPECKEIYERLKGD
jgi:hypothetical protein